MTDTRKFHGDIKVVGNIQLPSETASKALQLDGSGNVESSTVTTTELGYLSGVTSLVQTQLNTAQAAATQALSDAADAQADIDAHLIDAVDAHDASAISNVPTGNLAATNVQAALNELQADIDNIASSTVITNLVALTGRPANSVDLGTFTGTTIPDSVTIKAAIQALETEIEALPDPIYYAGVYNASTNTPTLSNADVGAQGALRYVTVAGSRDFGAGSITFAVGDKVVNNGTTYDKWDDTSDVVSVNGLQGAVVLTTDEVLDTLAVNKYFSDERAQDAVGAILANSSTISLTYTDATPDIVAQIIAQMSITYNASGVKLVNDAATPGNTKYYGTNGTGVKGFYSIPAVGSSGDIQETTFAAANNQVAVANVTGLAFANGVVRSFNAQVSVVIDATARLYEVFKLEGIQKGASWDMSSSSVGDDSGLSFSITNAGQVRYTSTSVVGFVSNSVHFKASTLSV